MANAPAAVTQLSTDFSQGALSGTISFILPTQTASGTVLSGSVDYEVLVDGQKVASGTGEPGQQVSIEQTLTQGSHKIKVSTSNAAGLGAQQFIVVWIGPDMAPAVSGLQFIFDKSTHQATLSWNAPEAGVNGGYIDTSLLSYNVTRYPGAVGVGTGLTANTFTETLEPETLTAYYYVVTLVYDGIEAVPAESNHILVGNALTLPYTQYFDTEDALDLFTIIDGNGNGVTWTEDVFSGAASYNDLWPEQDGDDWLLAPPVQMKSDRQYTISFKVRGQWEWYIETFAAALGQGDDPNLYAEVIPVTDLMSGVYEEYRSVVTVPQDGDYRFGIHALSYAYSSTGILVDSLSIQEGAKFTAPDSVTNMVVVPGQHGAKTATVSFITPTTTANGQALNELSSAILLVDGNIANTLTSVNSGEQYSLEATGIEGDGWHTFTVVVSNNGGEDLGVTNSAVAWIGYDVPLAPGDVRLSDNLDGTSTLTWTAPAETGLHGGYVDTSLLTYNVYSIIDFQTMDPVETDIKGTSYVSELEQTGEQQLIEWAVTAVSAGGEGAATAANTMFSGEAYTIPFHESFANGGTDMPIWGVTEMEGAWSLFFPTTQLSADGDNGSIIFNCYNPGEWSAFYSGKISLAGADNPKLIFSYYAVPGLNNLIELYVRTPDGNRLKLDEVDFSTLTGDEGWRRMGVDLNPLKGYAYINLDFQATVNDIDAPIYIDDINIRDAKKHDIEVKLEASKSVLASHDITAKVNVENIGDAATGALTLNFFVGNTLVETRRGEGVEFLADSTYTFIYTTRINESEELAVHATVILDEEPDAAFETESAIVEVVQPGLTTITDLAAGYSEEGVQLTWSLPLYMGEKLTEGFEGYEAFSIGGADGSFGEWKTVDGDQQMTAGLTHFTYDHLFDPKGFMIFQPANLWKLMYPQLTPYEGDQYAAAFSPEYVNADDWLISPALSGAAQTISLYVRSYTVNTGLEDFEIRYSTAGNAPADFSTTAYAGQAPIDWTEVQVELPVNARYFAIHYTSKTKVMLMVDAVKYEKGDQTVAGFRVYRDGELIDEIMDAEATGYVDTSADGDIHTYNVTIVYAAGESSFSNDASLLATAIGNTPAGATAADAVYNLNGQRLAVPQRGINIMGHRKIQIVKSEE